MYLALCHLLQIKRILRSYQLLFFALAMMRDSGIDNCDGNDSMVVEGHKGAGDNDGGSGYNVDNCDDDDNVAVVVMVLVMATGNSAIMLWNNGLKKHESSIYETV